MSALAIDPPKAPRVIEFCHQCQRRTYHVPSLPEGRKPHLPPEATQRVGLRRNHATWSCQWCGCHPDSRKPAPR